MIINASTLQHHISVMDRRRCATIFFMNCEINEDLSLEYYNEVKRIYFMRSLVAIGDLKTNLSLLLNYHPPPGVVKIVVYEKDLKDEEVEEAAIRLVEDARMYINFILVSKTKLLANNSSYSIIA